MAVWIDRSLMPGPLRDHGFEPAGPLTDDIPTSGSLLAALTVPQHIHLLDRALRDARPWAPSLVDLVPLLPTLASLLTRQ